MIYFIEKQFHSKMNELIKSLEFHGYDYQLVEIIPFTTEIIHEPINHKNIFCFGSIKMANIASKLGWNPGSLYNSNHDYRVYSQYYKENMLNWDSQIIGIGDDFKEPGYLFHARPCEDTKLFTGQVFTKQSWNEMIDYHFKNPETQGTVKITLDTPVQISKLKTIYREIRFFIVDKEIITASQYQLNNRLIPQRVDEHKEPQLFEFVNKMVQLYQPAKAFVMDIAMTDEGLKIVELNCFNCSGYYDIDFNKLTFAVNNFFTK
jgi:hypothetical protein